MTPLRFPLALTLILLGACRPVPLPPAETRPGSPASASLEAEVRATVEELTAAMNSGDPGRVLAFYREGRDFVYLGCTDLIYGSRFFAGIMAPFIEGHPELGLRRDLLELQLLGPSVAVVTLRGSSSRADALFTTQVLLREEDGRWLVAHEHESWPGCREPVPPHPTGSLPTPGDG